MAPRAALMAPSIAPARAAAFDVVRRVFEDEAYADRALRGATAGLDDRDRALARQLAYGTVQRTRTLDHAIETIGRRPVRKNSRAAASAVSPRSTPPVTGCHTPARERCGERRMSNNSKRLPRRRKTCTSTCVELTGITRGTIAPDPS